MDAERGAAPEGADIIDVLAGLYASEINVMVASFWDGGWTATLGDDMNGFGGTVSAPTLGELATKLTAFAVATHPTSHFARRHHGEVVVGPWVEDMRRAARRAADPGAGDEVGRLRAEVERLTRERDEARVDADQAADERDELRDAPWPKWADECLSIIRKHSGYDGSDDAVDGVDLPAELEETLGEYEHQAQRNISEARVAREVESYRSATEWYKAQASGLRDKLAVAEARAEAARAVLRQCEWEGIVSDDMEPTCPICGETPTGGHAPDCPLAAQIGGTAREGASPVNASGPPVNSQTNTPDAEGGHGTA